MQKKEIPITRLEEKRLATLDSYQIMDSPSEAAFDRLTRLAANIFETPMASVSFVHSQRQWFKSIVGIDASETSRDIAFCSHIVTNKNEMVIEDTAKDNRFNCNPLVLGPPFIRFYAGYPLIAPNGMVLGTLWVGDIKPRQRPSADKLAMLESLAEIVMSELELRREVKQRQIAEQDSAQAKLDLDLALALSSTASWKLDLSTDEIDWGGAYLKVWGEDADQALTTGEKIFARIHPEDTQNIRDAVQKASSPDNTGYNENFRIILPSGEIRWLLGRGNVTRNLGSDFLTGVNFDITASIEQQEQQKLHTRELHHRLRNLFATLQSIMTLTKSSATSIDDYVERIEGRLRALNRAQQILLDTNFITGSMTALVNDLCASYPKISWSGPDSSLPENAMVSLSLILHELATNASKYGALSSQNGKVNISWKKEMDHGVRSINLVWLEKDGPAIDAPPSKKGFGSSLVDHSVARNLKGKIDRDWNTDGLVCSISFPFSDNHD